MFFFIVFVFGLKYLFLTSNLYKKIPLSVLFHSKMKGSDNQEKLVYQIIEDAGNKGSLINYNGEW